MAKQRRLNRNLVVERAAQMVDEAGAITAVSLTALAESLEIRTPSLYNHVANLDDLRYGLAVYGNRLLLNELKQASVGLVGEEAILAMATVYRLFSQAHPGLYPLLLRAPDPDETELQALSQEFLQFLLLIMGSLGLQGDDAYHAIRGFRAMLHGFASLEASGGFKMALDPEESYRRLVLAFLEGLP